MISKDREGHEDDIDVTCVTDVENRGSVPRGSNPRRLLIGWITKARMPSQCEAEL